MLLGRPVWVVVVIASSVFFGLLWLYIQIAGYSRLIGNDYPDDLPNPKDTVYRVDVTVQIEGEVVTVSGTFQCRYWEKSRWEAFDSPFLRGYKIRNRAMSLRLQSGAGLIVVPEPRCLMYNKQPTKPEIPLILWLNDADTPTVMEAYVSQSFYQSISPRLKFLSMKYGQGAWDDWVDPAVAVPWLSAEDENRTDVSASTEVWTALYSVVVPRVFLNRQPQLLESFESPIDWKKGVHGRELSESISQVLNIYLPTFCRVRHIPLSEGTPAPLSIEEAALLIYATKKKATEEGLEIDQNAGGGVIRFYPDDRSYLEKLNIEYGDWDIGTYKGAYFYLSPDQSQLVIIYRTALAPNSFSTIC